MRGTWFLAFSCAIFALTVVSAEEPTCLVYSTATLQEAVEIVHSKLDKKYPGQSDRSYGEGTLRDASPDDDAEEEAEESGVDALRTYMKEQAGRKKRSTTADNPIYMEFGDMIPIYGESEEQARKNRKHPSGRNITCTQKIDGNDVTVELPPYLVTLFDVKAFFHKLYVSAAQALNVKAHSS